MAWIFTFGSNTCDKWVFCPTRQVTFIASLPLISAPTHRRWSFLSSASSQNRDFTIVFIYFDHCWRVVECVQFYLYFTVALGGIICSFCYRKLIPHQLKIPNINQDWLWTVDPSHFSCFKFGGTLTLEWFPPHNVYYLVCTLFNCWFWWLLQQYLSV